MNLALQHATNFMDQALRDLKQLNESQDSILVPLKNIPVKDYSEEVKLIPYKEEYREHAFTFYVIDENPELRPF